MKVALAIQVFRSSGEKIYQDFLPCCLILAFPYLVLLVGLSIMQSALELAYIEPILRCTVLSVVGVATMRLSVSDRQPLMTLIFSGVGVRGLRFFIFVVVVCLVVLIFKGLIDLSTELLVFFRGSELLLTLLFSIFVVSRFLLIFPAVALDRELTLMRSFRITRPHYLSIFVVGMALGLICLIPIGLYHAFPSLVASVVTEAIGLICFSYGCIAVSYLYLAISSKF